MNIKPEDPQIYDLLLDIGRKYGFDPSSSVAIEDYFRQLLTTYQGELKEDSIAIWLEEKVEEDFISLSQFRPKWIQHAQWPVHFGKPMRFVGQIDIDRNETNRDYFHDDTSYYVFTNSDGDFIVISQQY